MKYFLITSSISNLSKLVYAETKYHAVNLIRHEFPEHEFKHFKIVCL